MTMVQHALLFYEGERIGEEFRLFRKLYDCNDGDFEGCTTGVVDDAELFVVGLYCFFF
jgi:hypothetical protein